MQQRTVNLPNKVGKHRRQQLKVFPVSYSCFHPSVCVSRNYILNLNLKRKTKRIQLIQTTRGIGM